MASLPLERAARLISASSSAVRARRVLGSRRGLVDLVGGAGTGVDEAVGDGPVEHGAGGGDDVLAGVPAAAAVSPDEDVGDGGMLQRLDVARSDRVQASVAPCRCHALPVAAVGAAGARSGGGDDLREVGAEGRDGSLGALQVGDRQTEPGQCHAGFGESLRVSRHSQQPWIGEADGAAEPP